LKIVYLKDLKIAIYINANYANDFNNRKFKIEYIIISINEIIS